MADNKHNKGPLEQLFRNKSNEFDISFNEADWEDMEQRLERMDNILLLDRQNKLMKKRFIAAAVLLIILAGLAFVILGNYNKINELKAQLSQQKIENNGENLTSERQEGNTKPLTRALNKGHKYEPIKAGKEPKKQALYSLKGSLAGTLNKQDINEAFPSGVNTTSSLWTLDIQNVFIYKPATKHRQASSVTALKSNAGETGNAVIVAALGRNKHTFSSTHIKDTREAFSGFAVGVTVGPDFSTVGSLTNFYIPGFKIGSTVEYSWNKNFSVSAGIIYSKANYTAEGSEYEAPYGFWSYGITPKQTIAACAILSIPVRLKYNFVRLDDSRFYVTAGVSSYIMLNETYRFNYARQDESHLIQSWSGHTGTRHWLSNATLSLGYEFDISNTISLAIEPYLNIPIRSVGWGSVELYSTGSLISVNYHFN